ncbi:phage baseplate assembly protein V, partial [Streptomyces niveus]|uniref:phage baseplate assembly protein V n=1 Tax=Streptomyces niveus TaxID=193462 RepID=UPI00369358EA
VGTGGVSVGVRWGSDVSAWEWAGRALSGGRGGGEAFIPEVGDEVLVGFEHGHLDRPYVLAGLYNGKDRPGGGGGGGGGDAADGGTGSPGGGSGGDLVDPTSGAVNRRAFASKSGNQLELLEAANGPQGVRLRTGDGKLTIALDRTNTAIVVNSDGSVTIEAKERVAIKAAGGVALDAGRGALELTGDSVTLTSRSGVAVDGGNGKVALSSGGSVEVRGGQVTVEGARRTDIKSGSSVSVNAPMIKLN